jgi:hypothetical protein
LDQGVEHLLPPIGHRVGHATELTLALAPPRKLKRP